MFEILVLLHIVALVIVNVVDRPADSSNFAKAYPYIRYAAGLITRKV